MVNNMLFPAVVSGFMGIEVQFSQSHQREEWEFTGQFLKC